jgi:hypothetical protein
MGLVFARALAVGTRAIVIHHQTFKIKPTDFVIIPSPPAIKKRAMGV